MTAATSAYNTKEKYIDVVSIQKEVQQGASHPCKITFENLDFEVNILLSKEEQKVKGLKTTRQKIVKGASGFALPGETLYIMGSSGAGKTSLLNMLSDRISKRDGQTVSGKILINDSLPLDQNSFGSLGAYVMQDDILYQDFTPREALTFAARLKLGGSFEEQDKKVEELLDELGLLGVANTVIGSVLQKTISGGERKRTAIGVELITNPSIILLDEPTSGLDSFKALQIVKLLDRQAKKGKTVITTIHQPSSEAFSTFDRLILMMDGFITYQGKAKDSTLHFSKIGLTCPMRTNPADYYMRILSVNYPKKQVDEKNIQMLTDHYNNTVMQSLMESHKQYQYSAPDISKADSYSAGVCLQFKMLMYRNKMGVKRNPGHGRVKIGQAIFMALLALALFHDQYEYKQALSLVGSLFFLVINQTMQNMMGTILTFQGERPVFLREQANKMYSVSAYYLAKILGELPILSLTPMLTAVIIYFKIGLSITASQFFYFYLILLLIVQCAASWGYFMSSIFNKEDMAVAMAPIVVMPLILFGGQFANSDNIQAWISWFQYLSPIRYSQEALVVNEFSRRTYDSNLILQNVNSGAIIQLTKAQQEAQSSSSSFNQTQWKVLQYPQINPADIMGFDVGLWRCLVILAAMTVALRLLSMLFLKLLVSRFQ